MNTKQPPVADRRPYRHSYHGVELEDPYFWLQDPNYPQAEDSDVLGYLNEEMPTLNHGTRRNKMPTQTLFEELKARKPEQDEAYPTKKRPPLSMAI